MLETAAVRKLLDNAVFVGQGLEHRVVVPAGTACVIKDYDPRVIDVETFEIFYKPAEHLFDYLTDHLLANHFFGDCSNSRGSSMNAKAANSRSSGWMEVMQAAFW